MDYSKQLCIICGIEPKIIQDNNSNDIEIYPDFTSPENFVKLFNLKFDYDENKRQRSLTEWILGYPVLIQDTNKYLKILVDLLETNEIKFSRDPMKNAIKHEKWEI